MTSPVLYSPAKLTGHCWFWIWLCVFTFGLNSNRLMIYVIIFCLARMKTVWEIILDKRYHLQVNGRRKNFPFCGHWDFSGYSVFILTLQKNKNNNLRLRNLSHYFLHIFLKIHEEAVYKSSQKEISKSRSVRLILPVFHLFSTYLFHSKHPWLAR